MAQSFPALVNFMLQNGFILLRVGRDTVPQKFSCCWPKQAMTKMH